MRLQLDRNPVYRKIIVPWWDSTAVCLVLAVCMILVCGFGIIGMTVARATPDYNDHYWIPLLVVVLSAAVLLSVAHRLFTRHWRRTP